ncbi:MAG TPA: CopG family transcriptional regulator [Methylomirabilota bacterium]
MKRTTIYLDPELEVLLKLESMRRGRPVVEIIREAVRAHLQKSPAPAPPGAGRFRSGGRRTAAEADKALEETGFGESKD